MFWPTGKPCRDTLGVDGKQQIIKIPFDVCQSLRGFSSISSVSSQFTVMSRINLIMRVSRESTRVCKRVPLFYAALDFEHFESLVLEIQLSKQGNRLPLGLTL
ncbi:hypothetical protein J6590_091017 [Homalodisca vitripennis]|nr:hypothetical protein J6590_091017 [Homalodisca vitripennis]